MHLRSNDPGGQRHTPTHDLKNPEVPTWSMEYVVKSEAIRPAIEEHATSWPGSARLGTRIEMDNDNLPPFEVVSRNLSKIGGLSIERFLQAPTDIDEFDLPYHIRDVKENSPTPPPPPAPPEIIPMDISEQGMKTGDAVKLQCVSQLHQACQRSFGKTDVLNYEFIELHGPNTKRCILTITRPNGARRSYAAPGVFTRKNEAKTQTTALAIEMGALEFVATGETDSSKVKNGLVLAPLTAHDGAAAAEAEAPPTPEDQAVDAIQNCCIEWRAGRVKPHWVDYTEPKLRNTHGTALRIELSPHSLRVYSTETKYDTLSDAKAACAKIALDQGVLEFIKHGNGQIAPEKHTSPASDFEGDTQDSESKAPSDPITLQKFYETFPQPFPEGFGDKSAAEINGPSWLNTIIQSARGGKLSTSFIWTNSGNARGAANTGLHGCLLRIERPQESRSYLVDSKFPKRADAKSAVCLQAIFQGVGDYIRDIAQELENRITPNMKRWAQESIFPNLGSEMSKANPGTHPQYEFPKDKDAFGCSITLELSSNESKTWSVLADYRSKVDAKIAVACAAAEQGAIEFLRFRGLPPPPDYRTFHSTLINGTAAAPNKRKDRDDDGNQERKKARIEVDQAGPPLLETKEEALARMSADKPARTSQKKLEKKSQTARPLPPRPQGPLGGGVSLSAPHSSMAKPKDHIVHGGPPIAPPQPGQFAFGPPPQFFAQAGAYPPPMGYPPSPFYPGYYPPPMANMPPPPVPYSYPPQYAGPSGLPMSHYPQSYMPAGPYGPHPSGHYPIPQHPYYSPVPPQASQRLPSPPREPRRHPNSSSSAAHRKR